MNLETVKDINEAIYLLKSGEILTSLKKDKFIYKKSGIYRYFDGSCFVLKEEDFFELYKDIDFYIYKDESVTIDQEKDEVYYRYYRK